MTDTAAGVAAESIGESLTVRHVERLRRELLGRLAVAGSLVIDLEAVKEVDTAGLQLLCAAHRSAVAAGKDLVLRGRSQAFREALRVTGLAGARGCDTRCPWQEENGDA